MYCSGRRSKQRDQGQSIIYEGEGMKNQSLWERIRTFVRRIQSLEGRIQTFGLRRKGKNFRMKVKILSWNNWDVSILRPTSWKEGLKSVLGERIKTFEKGFTAYTKELEGFKCTRGKSGKEEKIFLSCFYFISLLHRSRLKALILLLWSEIQNHI